MKFEIKNRWNGEILFSVEAENWRFAVEAAIKAKADLTSADLTSADLTSADLTSANLTSANLTSANLTSADLTSANLTSADLTSANLTSANLTSADLTSADLTSADLTSADLTSADLTSADLTVIRNDFWSILLFAQPEIAGLRQAIVDGKIDGSTYSTDGCSCLVGTVAKQRKCSTDDLQGNLHPDSSRPAERFFMGIKPGDTPETNPASKIVLEWLDTFVEQTK